jgi:diguanylate cyclase (GGDEF)-like protein/PAS domain S-box-containing protein
MKTLVDEKYFRDVAGMLDALPERVIRYRLVDLTVVYCNASWAAGHNVTPADVIGHSIEEFLSAGERVGLKSQLARIGPDQPLLADDIARPAPNAPGQWVEWVDQYLPGEDGAQVLAVGRDVTGRHIAELNLADSEARFRDLADKSADVVWRFVIEPHPHFDYVSPSVERILGYPPSFFVEDATRFLDVLDDEGRRLIGGAIAGEKTLPDRCDFRFRRSDGSIVIGEMHNTVIPGGLQGVGRDVTELRHLQQELATLALHDPLTGLANRRLFNELLVAALARTQRTDLPLAVAFIDLDDFKTVNDTYGHDAGDIVLCETARRLLSIVRASDVVARIGGDEFVVVFEPGDPNSSDAVARIEAAVSAPINITAVTTVRCPASVGYTDTRTTGRDPAALLAAADAAMYDVKRARQDTVRSDQHPRLAAAGVTSRMEYPLLN